MEVNVLVVAKRPDNVTYQIAFCVGAQSSDGTMDNDEGDYDCILWRSYGLDKEWRDWRQLTSGNSGKDDGNNPFVMYGKYDLTQYPRGIECMDEAAADNASWTLDYTIPPISITNSVLGTVELKAQDEVYDGLTESDKGKTFSAFAEYKKDENYARAKIIIDDHPICKKDYAILKSSKELSFIRLYLGDFTVNDIFVSSPGPDGEVAEAYADISFTYPKNNNPEIYILNYVFLTDDRGNFKNGRNGFNAGDQSDASDGGGAIGRLAKTASGGAVGSEAESNNGFAGGYHVKAAIGANASAYHGGAVGSGSQAGNGFAGGINAKCGKAPNGEDVDCIQLGAGTNGSEKTLQVYGYQLLDKNGYIPNERMEKGTLKNPEVVSETELNKTWQPGWYLCNFNSELVPTEGILRGQQLVQVINETYIDENGVTEYDVIQFIYDVGGIGYCRDAYNDSVNSFDKVLDGDSFSNWEHSRINNDVTSLKAEIETLKAEIQELKANFIKNGDKVVIDANGDE